MGIGIPLMARIPQDPRNPFRDFSAAAAAGSTGALAVTNAPLPCKYPKGDIADYFLEPEIATVTNVSVTI